MTAKDRIIVALDVDNLTAAKALISQLTGKVGYFKVGLELLMQAGPKAIIDLIHQADAKVFIDGKFNDIPNTVAGAVKAAANLGTDMMTVHAATGQAALEAAVAARGNAQILAVTVLTSLGPQDVKTIFNAETEAKVLQLAELAAMAGVQGIVSSTHEVPVLMTNSATKRLIKVTPGIRPAWAATGDQKRIVTPAEAISMGSDLLVIGRPITQPPAEIATPAQAAEKIVEEIESYSKPMARPQPAES